MKKKTFLKKKMLNYPFRIKKNIFKKLKKKEKC